MIARLSQQQQTTKEDTKVVYETNDMLKTISDSNFQ